MTKHTGKGPQGNASRHLRAEHTCTHRQVPCCRVSGCRIKAWGVVVDLVNNVVRPPVYPLPALIVRLAERMTGLPGLPGFRVTSANALDYRREADWLTPHADHRCDNT